MLDLLTELLHVGGRELMDRRSDPRTFEKKRSQSDLVTDADRASEEIILNRLRQLAPQDGIVSEEFGFSGGSSGRTWVIDPLDGTANYGTGLDDFGVIIGLTDADRAVAGGMYLPALDLLYLATVGGGATRNGVAICTSSTASIEDAFVDHSLMNLSLILDDQARTLAVLVRTARAVRCNHSLRYLAYVAEGVYDAFVYHSLGLWDLVGPSVILAEAGVTITALDGACTSRSEAKARGRREDLPGDRRQRPASLPAA